MSDITNISNVVGAKTARACDGCMVKRARWFCAADDAFLCQSCDSRVHTANPVARRHERVCLKYVPSFISHPDGENQSEPLPRPTRVSSWHSRKARTPRGKQQNSGSKSPASGSEEVVKCMSYLVPEIVMSDETKSFDESDGQLLYGRVPIFDSAILLCSTRPQRVVINASETENEYRNSDHTDNGSSRSACFNANEMKGFVGNFFNDMGFVPTDIDLEEFAADVESLLGKGLENDESFGIHGLGLMMEEVDGSTDTSSVRPCGSRVKDEDEIEMANEAFKLDFDYNDDEKVEVLLEYDETIEVKKRKILLRLDYESILSAWDGSVPWPSGTRPDVDPNQCWPTCLATCQIESHQQHLANHAACLNGRMGQSRDGGREARVSRYREKRRTRLFSKKIRYEVRKLNAEKRPRMKGRFVKRPSVVSLFS